MLRSLTPEQHKIYLEAQKEHVQMARRLRQVAGQVQRNETEPAANG